MHISYALLLAVLGVTCVSAYGGFRPHPKFMPKFRPMYRKPMWRPKVRTIFRKVPIIKPVYHKQIVPLIKPIEIRVPQPYPVYKEVRVPVFIEKEVPVKHEVPVPVPVAPKQTVGVSDPVVADADYVNVGVGSVSKADVSQTVDNQIDNGNGKEAINNAETEIVNTGHGIHGADPGLTPVFDHGAGAAGGADFIAADVGGHGSHGGFQDLGGHGGGHGGAGFVDPASSMGHGFAH